MAVYKIYTEDDLYAMRNDMDGTYELQNDIRLTKWQTGNGWTPIPEFRGVLDGAGHTIHDLYINQSGEGAGFIKYLNACEIKNINFSNANVLGGEETGILGSYAKGLAEKLTNEYQTYDYISKPVFITNVKVDGIVRSSSGNLGGLLGSTRSDISPSRWDDRDMINAYITNTHINAQIYAFADWIGGAIGGAHGGAQFSSCSTRGNIYNANKHVGGFMGQVPYHRGHMENCYSVMNIQGNDYIGGLIGIFASGHLQNMRMRSCYFAGTLVYPKNNGRFIGGSVGYGGQSDGVVLVDKEKLGFSVANTATSLDEINTRASVKEYTTAEMAKLETYYRNGFSIYSTWLDDLTSSTDTIQLRSEVPSAMIKLDGSGTEEDPYLIRDIYDLVAIDEYDRLNWEEYFNKIYTEYNNPSHENFKENYKMPHPTRWHYKLVSDIDLNVYPYNEEGWIPLSIPVSNDLNKQNWYIYHNSIGQPIGVINDAGVINTATLNSSLIRKGFIGNLNGNGFKIKNLLLKEFPVYKPSDNRAYIGLFDTITGGTVRNLTLDNVKIDFDFYRDINAKDSYIGAVASRIQGTTTIDRVTVKGESFIKDYRADVNGAKVSVAGLVNYSTRFNDAEYINPSSQPDLIGFSGSRLKSTISNCNVQIKNTYTNVVTSDDYNHFVPFMNEVSFVTIQDCYSACSNTAKDARGNVLNGVHGKQVFIGSIGVNAVTKYVPSPSGVGGTIIIVSTEPSGIIKRCYYDSDIVNAESSPKETYVEGKVEIFGRPTNAMKLQATYVGWDFTRTWKTDGQTYPSYRPYDATYTPPTRTVTHTVTTIIDAPYAWVDSRGINRQLGYIVAKSTFKKPKGKTTLKRKSTVHMNTQVQPLYSIAFEYDAPQIGNRSAETEVIELNCGVKIIKKTRKENTVESAVEPLNCSIEAKGVNKGAFFNAIQIVSIGVNSVLVKVNDKRIKQISFQSGYYDVSEKSYVTLTILPSSVNEGNNTLTINAIDENGSVLTDKKIKVNKLTATVDAVVGDNIVVNNEYYKVTNFSSNTITLDKNLTEKVFRITQDGQFNSVELIRFTNTPKLSIGEKGHTPAFKTGKFISAKRNGNKVEEEYEFVGEGQEVITEMNFSRQELRTQASSTQLDSRFSVQGIPLNLSLLENGDTTNGGILSTYKYGYQLYKFDVMDFIDKNIIPLNKINGRTMKNKIEFVLNNLTINFRVDAKMERRRIAIGNSNGDYTVLETRNAFAKNRSNVEVAPSGVNFNISNLNALYRESNSNPDNEKLWFYLVISTPEVPLQTSGQKEEWHLVTGNPSYTINLNIKHPEITVVDDVKQIFIPKEQNTTL